MNREMKRVFCIVLIRSASARCRTVVRRRRCAHARSHREGRGRTRRAAAEALGPSIKGVHGVKRVAKPAGRSVARASSREGRRPVTGDDGLPARARCAHFPADFRRIIDPFVKRARVSGVWNKPASGTEIIVASAPSIATKKPIVYTSADSVFRSRVTRALRARAPVRVLAHRAEILDPYGVGRVIARPFVGARAFKRTLQPPRLLDIAAARHRARSLEERRAGRRRQQDRGHLPRAASPGRFTQSQS